MVKPPEKGYGQDAGNLLRPIDELLKESKYPNLIEEYHQIAEKDIYLAELYRLAATQSLDELHPNPVQAVLVGGELRVDILAELKEDTDLAQLQEIMRVHAYTRRFVSGQIPVERLPELNEHVKRMQTARPIRPATYDSLTSIHADQQTLGQALPGVNPTPDGSGVIVGIVDIGCDFVHQNFRDANGQTRLLFLWDQREGLGTTNQVPYGREFNQHKLNEALNKSDPYAFLNYKPKDGAHGTHVMDIAAGSSSLYPGVAPGADLIFVHLGLPSPIEVEQGFLGSSTRLYDAVEYIFAKADVLGKPAVVNLSIATNGGSHDGTSLVESMFDDLLSQSGRAIVVAAGNSFQDDIHTNGTAKKNQPSEIEWFIQSHAQVTWDQRQEMEIWYESPADFNIEILASTGQIIGTCPIGETRWDKKADFDQPIMLIKHAASIDDLQKKYINVFIDDRYPQLKLGAYRFRLSLNPQQTDQDMEFHAWIERNDEYPSRFTPKCSKSDFTINSIGNARLPIVVGAFNSHDSNSPIADFSSSGPSRNQNASSKPDISAPGVNIFAARALHSGLDDGISKQGTSMAAPHVTGLIALMFQAAAGKNPPEQLFIQKIQQILTETADHNPPQNGGNGHDARYGFGRVNGAKALIKVLA